MTEYTATADKLVTIIAEMFKTHPEMMTMTSVFDLFKIEGFKEKIEGLEPSLAQSQWAFGKARSEQT